MAIQVLSMCMNWRPWVSERKVIMPLQDSMGSTKRRAVISGILALMVTTVVSPAANGASMTGDPVASSIQAGTATACPGDADPTWFDGGSYCNGFVIGVKRTAYGIGTPVVLRGVLVVGAGGTSITVQGGPSCLNPSAYCGAMIPDVNASVAELDTRPVYGDVVNLYGVTGNRELKATGFEVTGHMDPDFGW
jgi:hypothetical protein